MTASRVWADTQFESGLASQVEHEIAYIKIKNTRPEGLVVLRTTYPFWGGGLDLHLIVLSHSRSGRKFGMSNAL